MVKYTWSYTTASEICQRKVSGVKKSGLNFTGKTFSLTFNIVWTLARVKYWRLSLTVKALINHTKFSFNFVRRRWHQSYQMYYRSRVFMMSSRGLYHWRWDSLLKCRFLNTCHSSDYEIYDTTSGRFRTSVSALEFARLQQKWSQDRTTHAQ